MLYFLGVSVFASQGVSPVRLVRQSAISPGAPLRFLGAFVYLVGLTNRGVLPAFGYIPAAAGFIVMPRVLGVLLCYY